MMFKIQYCQTSLAFLLTASISLAHVPIASAAIYKWIDNNGNTHYSDEKPKDDSIQLETIRIAPRAKQSIESSNETEKTGQQKQTTDDQDNDADNNDPPTNTVSSGQLLAEPSDADKKRRANIKTTKQLHCEKARMNLAILSRQIPAYLDDKEGYRLNWAGDTYSGERHYLSVDDRKTAVKKAEAAIKENCQNPDDNTAQDIARKKWINAEYCQLNRAILDDLQRADIRASRRQVLDQQALTEKYCNIDEEILLSSDYPEPELFPRQTRN